MSGRVVIVTGANTGIGNRTAFHLARMGAKVIMACRSIERGEAARAKIEEEIRFAWRRRTNPGISGAQAAGTLEVIKCDLGSLQSVREFARTFKERHGQRLDVLVNNAGVGIGGTITSDGLNECFGANFIGHFVLTMELMPLIQATDAARVVCLSSVTHHVGCTEWESSAGGHKGHRGRSTYADGKLAMVLFAKELRRRFKAAGSSATAFSVNPGAVRSDIWRAVPKMLMPMYDVFMRLLYLDVEKGSRTSVCTSTMELESLSGEFRPKVIRSDYYQPYWLPFDLAFPFEIMGPFVGCAPGRPSLPKDEPTASAEMWSACTRIVRATEAARSGAPTSS
ncbi:unnamed protein product [Ascophyllum nodosum]